MSARLARFIVYRICIYPSPDEAGAYIAHCLELDLIGVGECVQSAITELIENIDTQTNLCLHTGAQLFVPAPPDVWKKYLAAVRAGRKVADELFERAVSDAEKRLGHKPPVIECAVASKQVPLELLGV
jgi:hypothetical protein